VLRFIRCQHITGCLIGNTVHRMMSRFRQWGKLSSSGDARGHNHDARKYQIVRASARTHKGFTRGARAALNHSFVGAGFSPCPPRIFSERISQQGAAVCGLSSRFPDLCLRTSMSPFFDEDFRFDLSPARSDRLCAARRRGIPLPSPRSIAPVRAPADPAGMRPNL
jgi:hypothetical protein